MESAEGFDVLLFDNYGVIKSPETADGAKVVGVIKPESAWIAKPACITETTGIAKPKSAFLLVIFLIFEQKLHSIGTFTAKHIVF